jgi:hypothetical protein
VRIVAELRRRLGGAFTAEELAELYDEGTGLVHPTSRCDARAPSYPVRAPPMGADAGRIA